MKAENNARSKDDLEKQAITLIFENKSNIIHAKASLVFLFTFRTFLLHEFGFYETFTDF